MADALLIAQIERLMRAKPTPHEHTLRQCLDVLADARNQLRSDHAPPAHRHSHDALAHHADVPLSAMRHFRQPDGDDAERFRKLGLSRNDRLKARMQPHAAEPEHLGLPIGRTKDPRLERYEKQYHREVVAPVDRRRVATRLLQHKMETAPHADAAKDGRTQIGSRYTLTPSMMVNGETGEPATLKDVADRLGKGNPAWWVEAEAAGPNEWGVQERRRGWRF